MEPPVSDTPAIGSGSRLRLALVAKTVFVAALGELRPGGRLVEEESFVGEVCISEWDYLQLALLVDDLMSGYRCPDDVGEYTIRQLYDAALESAIARVIT